MCMLSGREILELIDAGVLVVKPFNPEIVRENGLDLRLGNMFCKLRVSDGVVDTRRLDSARIEEYYDCVEVGDEGYVIQPGEKLLAHTLEWIELPTHIAGLANLRSTFARLGLDSPPTVVDAGFRGQLTIELHGSTFPIRVYPGQRLLHLVLFRIEKPGWPYRGKYDRQRRVTLPKPDRR